MTDNQIKLDVSCLGFLLRDRMTGFQGVACSYHEKFHAEAQIGLAPKATDDLSKLPEAMSFDVGMLELVKEEGKDATWKVIESVQPEPHDIKLGDKVEDIVSEFKGTVTTLTTFQNGCVWAHVVGKVDEKGRVPSQNLPIPRLKVLEVAPPPQLKAKPPGGPPERVFSR